MQKNLTFPHLLFIFFFTVLALPAFAVEPQSPLTIHSDKLLLLDATYAGKNIIALGERGPVWWDDGAPDLNRRKVEHTPYAAWWATRDKSLD